jgi:acyl-coenzyme A synthetase/AMP-(fatty) acid ligase
LDIWRFCRNNIAVYKVPRTIEFLQQPLPKTGQGKIDRQQLRKHEERSEYTFLEQEARAAAAKK